MSHHVWGMSRDDAETVRAWLFGLCFVLFVWFEVAKKLKARDHAKRLARRSRRRR